MGPSPAFPSRHLSTLATHTGPINCIGFSKLGGTYILTGSSDRSIHLSRTESNAETTSTSTTKPDELRSESNKNSKSNGEETVRTISAPIQKYTSHGYPVLSVTVSGQNTHFASTGADRAVFYWDIQTASSTVRRFGVNTNQAHTARITCVSFAGRDDGLLVSGSDDRSVRIWDVKSRDTRPLQVMEEAKDSVTSLLVHGTDVVVGSVDGRVRTYDVRMGGVTTDVQPGPVTSLDLSKDGKMLLVGCLDGKLRVMDRENGQLLKAMPRPDGDREDHGARYRNSTLRLQSCFGLDAAVAVSGSEDDGRVRAWDLISGTLVSSLAVSPDNKVVSVVRWRDGSRSQQRQDLWAAGSTDGIVKVFGA